METTRHFTATVYVVHDGATALHEHPRLGIRVPPGGHVDRDELPHRAGIREVREETGLDPTLLTEADPFEVEAGRSLPRPRHRMLYDVNVHDGDVGHQHVDSIFYATVDRRELDPADDEPDHDAWRWYAAADLRSGGFDADVARFGREAIELTRER